MADDISVRLNGDNSNFRSMMDSSQSLVGKFSQAFNAIGVGVGAAAVIGFFKSVTDRGGELQDLSDRLGVNTDHLQAFDFAVRQAGGSSAQANMVWDKSRKAFDELAIGSKTAVDNFAALGLSAKSFDGLGLADALALTAKGYAENADKAGAYEAMMEITGAKSGPALNAVLLQLGSEGFPALLAALDASGNKMEKDTIRQLDQLGDAAEKNKMKLVAIGASFMGFILSIGEGIGALAGNAVNLVQGLDMSTLEQSAQKAEVAVKALTPAVERLTKEGEKQVEQAIQKDFAENAGLARTERINLLKKNQASTEAILANASLDSYSRDVMIVGLAETKKLIGQEETKLSADRLKHQAQMESMTAKEIEDKMKLLPISQQLGLLKASEAGWSAVIADSSGTVEQNEHAQLEREKVRDKMRDLRGAKIKEETELATLLLKPAADLTEVEKLRLEVLTGVTTQRQLDAEQAQLTAGLIAGSLTEAEKGRLAVLMGITVEGKKQLEDSKEMVKIWGAITRTGKGYDQQSDTSLGGVIARLESQIHQMEISNFGVAGGVGGKGKPAEQYLLESELFNAKKELAERQKVQNYADQFGEDKTRARYGDSLTDKALRDWTDQQTATTLAVQDIQQRLAVLFPKK